MPELPDVENFKRYLDATALHERISGVHVADTRVLDGISRRKLAAALDGQELEETCRRGKMLYARISGGGWLSLHFGMTGYLDYFKETDTGRDHDRVLIEFDNGYHLAYVNRRLFGKVGLVEDIDDALSHLGPDALEISRGDFLTLLDGRNGQIKSALMDQGFLAGMGNIYTDEALFQAGLHPKRKIADIDEDDRAELWRQMRHVLRVAIRAGAGREGIADRVPDSFLLPVRSGGADCPKGCGAVRKIKAGGRAGYYCPSCQPETR